ncbi:integrase core domain-containing protein [Rhizobium ruizarguesonis]
MGLCQGCDLGLLTSGKADGQCLHRSIQRPLPSRMSEPALVPDPADAREKMEDWRRDYNEVRPHGAIGNKVPILLMNPGGVTSPPP